MKKIIKYLIQGLLYTVPIGITLYLVIVSIKFLDKLIPIKVPGIGFLIVLTTLVFVGYMGSVVLASSIGSIIRRLEKLVLKLPLIRMIYTALKDLFSALIGTNKTFDQAVIVKLDKANDIEKIGFVTKTDLSYLGIGKDKVSVYFPYSYGIMGDLRIVPKDAVRPIRGKSSEIMKFIVSGGVVQFENSGN